MTKSSSQKLSTLTTLGVFVCLFLLKACSASEVLSLSSNSLSSDPATRGVYVVYGGDSSPSLHLNMSSISLNPVQIRFMTTEEAVGGWLGEATSATEDLKTDGPDSLKNGSKGVASMVHGGPKASLSRALNFEIRGDAHDDNTFKGFISAVGDINNDGYDDLILVAYETESDHRARVTRIFILKAFSNLPRNRSLEEV